MAGVDLGGSGSKKRAMNSDVNMIPFIDLLMVTIAFLLITAVWVNKSRINADAQVPGQSDCHDESCLQPVEKMLHVTVGDNDFNLVWKQAGTVLSETHIPKAGLEVGEGSTRALRYPDLAKAVETEWSRQGQHLDPSDRKVDQAVLHSDNKTSFKEIVAVLDAIHATQRDMKISDGSIKKLPAFNMVFATR